MRADEVPGNMRVVSNGTPETQGRFEDEFDRLIAAHVTPVLERVGFHVGSRGVGEVLFCGPPSSGQHFPWIAESYGDQELICLDVLIEADPVQGITRADFEVSSLVELLHALGLTQQADELRHLAGGQLERQIQAIGAAAESIFGSGPTDL